MLAAIPLIAILQAQIQDPVLEKDPSVIISKTMSKYWNASSLTGTIVQTTSDGGGSLKVTSNVSYQRPGYISVQQDYVGRNGLALRLVSNGERFEYDPPFNTPLKPKPKERLKEPVVIPNPGTRGPTILKIGDMYHAAHLSLMPSTLLDLAIAHKEHLSDFRINVRTLSLSGVVQLGGKEAYKIVGAWQSYKGADDVQMRYELYVSLDFDLLRFQMTQPFMVKGQRVVATTIETADLRIDVPVDMSLFVVK